MLHLLWTGIKAFFIITLSIGILAVFALAKAASDADEAMGYDDLDGDSVEDA